MKKNLIITIFGTSLFLNSCVISESEKENFEPEVDSVLFELANRSYYDFMKEKYFYDVATYHQIGINKDLRILRKIWQNFHDTSISKNSKDSLFYEYADRVKTISNKISKNNPTYKNQLTKIIQNQENSYSYIHNDIYKLTIVVFRELNIFSERLHYSISFDSISFESNLIGDKIKLEPKFHDSPYEFGFVINNLDTHWVLLENFDSLYFPNTQNDSLEIVFLGFDRNHFNYSLEQKIKN